MHQPIPVQGKWLGQVVKGYFNFHAVPTNSRALGVFRHRVTMFWRRVLQHRSHKAEMTWVSDEEARKRLAAQTAYPTSLAKSTLRRQTPKVGAGCPNGLARFCAGGAQQ